MTATVLIIDDEPDIRELIALTLSRMGMEFHAAANLEEARNLLGQYEFDVCLTDMRLPDGNGIDFVKHIQSQWPELPVAVITAHGNMEAAVDAMKNGAYDFVSKPVDITLLRQLVVRAIALNANNNSGTVLKGAANDPNAGQTAQASQGEPTDSRATLQGLSGRQPQVATVDAQSIGSDRLIGLSDAMKSLRTMIAKVARTNAPVWITGESGTGKEVIARLIHDSGPRAAAPFVAINCGAIPNELMESELFGHKKGSFTGANADQDGLFKRANGGTLFLDEVAELPLHMQVKLLRAIQERSIRAVGSHEETQVDVRILSASHKDLASEVDTGNFRHDLYYRLNVITLESPALRSRPDDIPALCHHFLARLSKERSVDALQISNEALEKLKHYSFPGNVRELENLLERAAALLDGHTIEASDLAFAEQTKMTQEVPAGPSTLSTGVDERTQIINVLTKTRWNRKAAAIKLGLTYRQLRYRIKQLGIDAQDP